MIDACIYHSNQCWYLDYRMTDNSYDVQNCYGSILVALSLSPHNELHPPQSFVHSFQTDDKCYQLYNTNLWISTIHYWQCRSFKNNLPFSENPNCRHTTRELSGPQEFCALHTLPHMPLAQNSNLPVESVSPPTRRTWPVSHSWAVFQCWWMPFTHLYIYWTHICSSPYVTHQDSRHHSYSSWDYNYRVSW